MKVSVILAHPDKRSFNHAIATASLTMLEKNGHEVFFHDLYEERFDPLLPAQEIPSDGKTSPVIMSHCQELSAADGIIIIHPNWWGQPPAVLKGWVDRVFRPGIAYEFLEDDKGDGIPVGLLRAGSAIVFNTSNTPEKRELSVFGDPLESLWKKCIFDLCGVKQVYRIMFAVVVTSTLDQRRAWLRDVQAAVTKYFPAETAGATENQPR